MKHRFAYLVYSRKHDPVLAAYYFKM